MEILILKTNINSKNDFTSVKDNLNDSYKINECTIDLDDQDKVVRVIGDGFKIDDVISKFSSLGYYCEELPD